MGLRNCCIRQEDINDFGYNLDRITTNIKPVFKLSSNEKIKFLDFSESDKVKRFKLKHKKRLILVTEDNTVSIVSYYLGNLTFLLTAFKVSDKYKIINCVFLSKKSSRNFVLLLEQKSNQQFQILILKLQKEENLPDIELQDKQDKEDRINDLSKNDIQKTNTTNNANYHSHYSTEVFKSNDRSKKAVESIINSSASSSDLLDSSDECISKTESNFKCSRTSNTKCDKYTHYFNILSKNKAKKLYEEIIMVKYNYYTSVVKFIIEDKNTNISHVSTNNNYIYVYSVNTHTIKCYKIMKSLRSYQKLFTSQTIFNDHFTNFLFPIYNENIFVIDGLEFIYYQNEIHKFKMPLKDFFHKNIHDNSENINFIKLTNASYYRTDKKLKVSNIDDLGIINFVITGICNLNFRDSNIKDQSSQQFISTLQIDFTDDNNNDVTKSKIKILKDVSYITEICFGPYDNGPILSGHINGMMSIWNMYDLTITKVIKVFDFDVSFIKIAVEPLGMTFCLSDSTLYSTHLIDKKYEYFYNENEDNQLERVIRFHNEKCM